jgi:selenocysteine-specific elongation factor
VGGSRRSPRARADRAEYKALTGASRKYTVPLMEHFDEQRVTIRVGDVRKLRRPA